MSGQLAKLSQAEGQRLGLPNDFKSWSPFPFAGMNQQDARTAIEDGEFYWVENFLLTGRGSYRTLWDKGSALYTASGNTIVYFQWFNIGASSYCALFFSDGTAAQVAYPSGAVTTITSTTGTFYNGGQLPVACQSGSQFLLIGNNLTTNSYWVWDGSVLYSAGSLGPYQIGNLTSGGSGYTSAPTVSFVGGSGSGATGTATISNGSVVSVQLTNPGTGYSPTDQVQIVFTGGGSDNGAQLTAVLASSAVTFGEVISGGSGYTTAPSVAITGGGGSGATATATVSGGVVTGITITAGGSGYTSTPSIGFSGGGGTGASAIAVLSSGAVASVTVVSGGSGFTGTPTLTFSGGGGSGAVATATISGGVITSVSVSAGGSGYTTPPAVVVATTFNRAAAGAINVMPFGISGTSIETFLSRVWISNPCQVGTASNGGVIQNSAPGSITNFSTSAGGNFFTNSDRFLRAQYVALHQSNGYLYPMGDSSVSVISNVQTTGSSATTTFNYQNTSSQIGVAWRDTVQDYGQAVLFGNANGVQGLYGGAVQRVSKKVNNIFDNVVLPASGGVTPSAAVANIHTIPVYLILLTVTDPFTKLPRTVMLGWDERNFLVASQSVSLTFIGTQEINSAMTAWGTDGTNLYPLFASPSTAMTKALVTKMFNAERPYIVKRPLAVYLRATDKTSAQTGVAATVTMESAGIAQQVGQPSQLPSVSYPNTVQPNFYAPDYTYPVWGAETSTVPGTALGATISSTSADFVLEDITIAYTDIQAIYS